MSWRIHPESFVCGRWSNPRQSFETVWNSSGDVVGSDSTCLSNMKTRCYENACQYPTTYEYLLGKENLFVIQRSCLMSFISATILIENPSCLKYESSVSPSPDRDPFGILNTPVIAHKGQPGVSPPRSSFSLKHSEQRTCLQPSLPFL